MSARPRPSISRYKIPFTAFIRGQNIDVVLYVLVRPKLIPDKIIRSLTDKRLVWIAKVTSAALPEPRLTPGVVDVFAVHGGESADEALEGVLQTLHEKNALARQEWNDFCARWRRIFGTNFIDSPALVDTPTVAKIKAMANPNGRTPAEAATFRAKAAEMALDLLLNGKSRGPTKAARA